MKAKVNSAKLASMGLDKARKACLIHAEKALTHQRAGNTVLFEMHCSLLDQCAAVGRKLKYGLLDQVPPNEDDRPTAEQLIGHAHFA
jgi:hypothetical protein